jgi:hypothetical protein
MNPTSTTCKMNTEEGNHLTGYIFCRILVSAAAALLFWLCAAASRARAADAPLPGWQHAGVFTVLTTPDGANLPAGAMVEQFPLLVRLHRDWFDFAQAKADGADVRFTTADGKVLPHQIEEWDAKNGTASVWVRVPRIEGNARLTLQIHWGKADPASAADAKAVFNESNGYLSVWHLG